MKRVLTAAIVLAGVIPFLGLATRIESTAKLGITLVALTGSAGIAFITRRFEAIICGAVIAALMAAAL